MEAHMQLGNYLVAYLRKIGLTHLFGIPGDLVIQLFMKFGQPHDIQEPDDDEWAEGLTMMRIVMQKETQARIVLGGKVDGYIGTYAGYRRGSASLPSVASADIFAWRLWRLYPRHSRNYRACRPLGRVAFSLGWSPVLMRVTRRVICTMDYTDEDNAVLARTPHIHQAVTLVSWGLRRILSEPANIGPKGGTSAQGTH